MCVCPSVPLSVLCVVCCVLCVVCCLSLSLYIYIYPILFLSLSSCIYIYIYIPSPLPQQREASPLAHKLVASDEHMRKEMDLQQRQHHLTCYPQLSRRNIKTGKLTRNSLSKMLSKIKLSAKYPSPQDANAQLLAIRQVYFRSIIGSVLAHQKGCSFFLIYIIYVNCTWAWVYFEDEYTERGVGGGVTSFSFYIYLNIAPGYGASVGLLRQKNTARPFSLLWTLLQGVARTGSSVQLPAFQERSKHRLEKTCSAYTNKMVATSTLTSDVTDANCLHQIIP